VTIAFPHHDEVIADIVLIAWQRVDTLRACLESLLAMTDAPPFGIRIAANGATTEVREFLRTEVVGATVVDLKENIGFGAGCNAAAAGSRARYLVFLNDDTVVEPRWLAELVAAADDETAVGSLLLNSDGTLQEAGARTYPNGYTQVIGLDVALGEAEERGLLAQRELDYASAAALLVPRRAFEELEGFDLAYRPAYWEDVDLCYRLRASGVRIVLQPSARVTHIGNGSSGGQPYFRAFAADRSHALFARRWANSLKSASSDDDPIERVTTIVDAPDRIDSGYPAVVTDVEGVQQIALDIKTEYAAWLGERFADSDRELARIRGILDAAGQDPEGHRAQVESLIAASPVHVLMWWRRARRSRRRG
jgi:GT2 family glycosyltransferase